MAGCFADLQLELQCLSLGHLFIHVQDLCDFSLSSATIKTKEAANSESILYTPPNDHFNTLLNALPVKSVWS